MATIDLATYAYNIVVNDKNFTSGIKNAEKQTEKFKEKTGELTNFLKNNVVAGITAVSVALGGMAIASIKASDQFDKAMNKLQASTGATTKEMRKLEESVKNIYGNKLGESIDDIAKSMSLVKQVTGETGKELESLTQNAVLLKDTFGFEVNESIRAASALMKNFGITGEQSFTLIAEGARNGADKNGDLLDTLNEYSVQFKSLGFNAEEFTNILIQGAQNGSWSIDKIGDSIKEFNIRAKDLSDTTMDAYNSLGLNAEATSQAFAKSGESAQEAFKTVLFQLQNINDPLERNRIGVQLFGTMFEDLEADAILSLGNVNKVADQTANTLEEINQIRYDSLGSSIEGLKRNLDEELLYPIGNDILPIFKQFVDGTNELIEMGGLGKVAITGLLVSITGVTLGFASAIPVINNVALALKSFSISLLTNPIGQLALAIGVVVPALAMFLGYQKQSKEQQEKLNQALAEGKQRFDDLSYAMNNVGQPTLQNINNTEELINQYNDLAESIRNVRDEKLAEFRELDERNFGKSFRTDIDFEIGDIPEDLQLLAGKLDINISQFKTYEGVLNAVNDKLNVYNKMLKDGKQNSTEYVAEQIKLNQGQVDNAKNTQSLVAEYKQLSGAQNKTEAQTKRLAEIEEVLLAMFPQEFSNRKNLISSLETEAGKRVELAEQGLGASRAQLIENRKITQNAYNAAIKNITIYQAEINKIHELWQARASQGSKTTSIGDLREEYYLTAKVASTKAEAEDLAKTLLAIDNSLNFKPINIGGGGYSGGSSDYKPSQSSTKIEEEIYKTDKFANALSTLEVEIRQTEGLLSKLDQTFLEYRNETDKLIYLFEKKKNLYHDEANSLREQRKAFKEGSKEYDELSAKINQLSMSWWDAEESINGFNKSLKESFKLMQDDVISSYKRTYEKQKDIELDVIQDSIDDEEERHQNKLDNLEEEYQEYEDSINKQLDLIDKLSSQDDYQKNLSKLQKQRQELSDRISVLSMDDSIENKQKLEELREELAEKTEEIEELQNDRSKELRKENLKGQLDTYKKDYEEDKKSEDKKYKTKKEFLDKQKDLVQEAYDQIFDILDGNVEDFKGEFTQLKDFLGENAKYFTGDLTTSLTSPFTAMLAELQNLKKEMGMPIESPVVNPPSGWTDTNGTGGLHKTIGGDDWGVDSNGNVYKNGSWVPTSQAPQEVQDLSKDIKNSKSSNGKSGGGSGGSSGVNGTIIGDSGKPIQVKDGKLIGGDGKSYTVDKNGNLKDKNGKIVKKVDVFGDGGIITKPTIALMGEKGTEAVFNTSQLNNLLNILNNPYKYNMPQPKTPIFAGASGKGGDVNYNLSLNIEKITGANNKDIGKVVFNEIITGLKKMGAM